MQNSSFSPTKSNQFTALKSPEDFNKKLNQIIDLNLVSIKQHAISAKKKLSGEPTIKETIEKQMKQQINENNHLLYNYLQEEDKSILQYLVMGMYNVFLTSNQKDSIFQKFRILNDEPLKLQLQDKVILEKRIQEKNKIIEESKDIIKQLQQKIDTFDVRIDQARMTISQNKRKEDNLYKMESKLQARDQYIQDIKQHQLIKLEELTKENENVQQRLLIMQSDRQQMTSEMKNIKRANAELDLALRKSNLICKQLSEKLVEIDNSNFQFIAKGTTILSSVFNPPETSAASTYITPQISAQDYRNVQERIMLQQQQHMQLSIDSNEILDTSKIQSIGITTPQSPENINLQQTQNQLNNLPYKPDYIDMSIGNNEQADVLNYKFEYVKLAEFLLSMNSLIQNNGGSLSIVPLKQMFENKKGEIQSKYIVATTMSPTKSNPQSINNSPIFKSQQQPQQRPFENGIVINKFQ